MHIKINRWAEEPLITPQRKKARPITLRVSVTPRMLREGAKSMTDPAWCPIALAIRHAAHVRKMGITDVWAGFLDFTFRRGTQSYSGRPSEKFQRWHLKYLARKTGIQPPFVETMKFEAE